MNCVHLRRLSHSVESSPPTPVVFDYSYSRVLNRQSPSMLPVLQMIFGVTAKKLISHDDAASQGSLWKCFDACTRGLLSFPLCVPGTAFYQCMQVNQLIKHAAMSSVAGFLGYSQSGGGTHPPIHSERGLGEVLWRLG